MCLPEFDDMGEGHYHEDEYYDEYHHHEEIYCDKCLNQLLIHLYTSPEFWEEAASMPYDQAVQFVIDYLNQNYGYYFSSEDELWNYEQHCMTYGEDDYDTFYDNGKRSCDYCQDQAVYNAYYVTGHSDAMFTED